MHLKKRIIEYNYTKLLFYVFLWKDAFRFEMRLFGIFQAVLWDLNNLTLDNSPDL